MTVIYLDDVDDHTRAVARALARFDNANTFGHTGDELERMVEIDWPAHVAPAKAAIKAYQHSLENTPSAPLPGMG